MKVIIMLLLALSTTISYAAVNNENYTMTYDSQFGEVIVQNKTSEDLSFEISGNQRSLMLNCETINNMNVCRVSKTLLNKDHIFIVHHSNGATSHKISSLLN